MILFVVFEVGGAGFGGGDPGGVFLVGCGDGRGCGLDALEGGRGFLRGNVLEFGEEVMEVVVDVFPLNVVAAVFGAGAGWGVGGGTRGRIGRSGLFALR